MFSIPLMTAGVGLLSLLPAVQAGFNPASSSNIAVYWGQNSANQASSQQRLSYYCQNAPEVNIIMLSFLVGINNPSTNFANAGNNCTTFSDNGLLNCPQIGADIVECQQTYGKTIMLSIGGATYTEGGFSSSSAAVAAANNVWAWFGPVQSGSKADRPFGSAVVDGFDLDLESANSNMEAFVAQLRSLSNAAGGKKYYLSAAPQCPYPDQADQSFINGQVAMDWLQIQFYNNYCGVGNYPNNWNYATWDNWAKNVSANTNAKVLVGIPASAGAGGGYASGSQLANALNNAKGYSSFGGVMMWDMSQLFANSGFLQEVVSDLGGSAPPPTTTSTTTKTPTSTPPPSTTSTTTKSPTTTSSGPAPTGTGLAQWAQCGGQGYNGPTQCAAPYTCVATSVWWSQCE